MGPRTATKCREPGGARPSLAGEGASEGLSTIKIRAGRVCIVVVWDVVAAGWAWLCRWAHVTAREVDRWRSYVGQRAGSVLEGRCEGAAKRRWCRRRVCVVDGEDRLDADGRAWRRRRE